MVTALITERISKMIASKALEATFEKAKAFLKEKKVTLISEKSHVTNAVEQHVVFVNQWSSEVSLKDMASSKKLHQVFVKLKVYSGTKRNSLVNHKSSTFDYENIFEKANRSIVVVGLPGAGKTTSMKFICQNIMSSDIFLGKTFYFPIVIRLKELLVEKSTTNRRSYAIETVTERLCKILGIKINWDTKEVNLEDKIWALRQMLYNIVEELKPIIILDGLDEISSHENRTIIAKEINDLGLNIKEARVILTTRSGEFYYNLEAFDSYEIAPLDEDQIYEFVGKWFKQDDLKSAFISQIKKSPYYDTTIRPLTLAHLCTIFENNHSIPEQPKSVYRFIIELLLKEWDLQNFVIRKSKYGRFEIDRKFEFLSCLAYCLTTELNSFFFNRKTLSVIYLRICSKFKLAENQVNEVIDELETHNGLFIKSGFDTYEFSHKSLQEFLTADYISRLPTPISSVSIIYKLPHELAIATSISSDPTLYFHEAIINKIGHLHNDLDFTFVSIFVKRLVLEKPLFSNDAILSIGIIELFTKFINYNKKEIQIEILNSFKLIWELDVVQESFRGLAIYYEIQNSTVTKFINDGNTLQLKQAKRKKYIDEEYVKKFRPSLYIPVFNN